MSDMADQLEKLAVLLEKGLMTREEFEEEKEALRANRDGNLPRSSQVVPMVIGFVAVVGLGLAIAWGMQYFGSEKKAVARDDDVEEEMEELEAELEMIQEEGTVLQRNMVEVENVEREEKELELAKIRLQEELRELKKELPNEREITDLLKGVSATANKVGLEVMRFTRIDEIPLAYYAEVPVEIEVYGGYHQVARFFDELSKMKRIVYVQDVSIGSPEIEGDDVAVTVTGHAVTFRFLSDSEIEAQDPSKKKGRKGGKSSR